MTNSPAHPGCQPHLILGFAVGYEPCHIDWFARSLVHVKFSGHVVLFVCESQLTPMHAFLAEFPSLDAELVVVRSINDYSKHIRSLIKRCLTLAALRASPHRLRALLRFQGMPHMTRYFYYADYLDAHGDFSHVLLSDVRDVVFQGDPFAHSEVVSQGLQLGMETPETLLISEPLNRGWIMDAYGGDMLRRIGDCQVCCSGVTLGGMEAIRRYVALMLGEIMRQPFNKIKTRLYDQAFHNKLLHCGELGQVRRCLPLDSPIATMGCVRSEQLLVSDDGKLLNRDGSVPPIVHQYNRHIGLTSVLEGTLRGVSNGAKTGSGHDGRTCTTLRVSEVQG